MQRLVNIVEQLSEAGTLIRKGGIAHERLALLLLDNAAEVLLQRVVEMEIHFDDEHERTIKRVRETMPAEAAKRFVREHGAGLLASRLKKEARRYFGPKVDLMVKKGHLDATTGQVIKALHRYRNDAYHREKIRKGTLRAAAILYFEVDCELFVSLAPPSISYGGDDDWSDFLGRFGLPSKYLSFPRDLQSIATKLREDIGIGTRDLAQLLADHLVSRIEDLRYQLEFIADNVADRKDTPEEELVRVQFWKERGPVHWVKVEEELKGYKPKYTIADLVAWEREADTMRNSAGTPKLELFKKFCDVEERLEPIEAMVDEVAMDLDREIQLEIDRRRGK